MCLLPLLVSGLAMVAPTSSPAQGGRPLNLLLDVCVLPADDCNVPSVMSLSVDDEPLRVGILRTEILSGRGGTGTVQTELTLRPMRAVGPKDLLAQLEPGARLRVRVSTRLSDRMMMLMSVEPSRR